MTLAEKYLGYPGRCFGSKGRVHHNNPKSVFVFNANVLVNDEKVWHGDLNLTSLGDITRLKDLAKAENKSVKVLSEMDGRFENEKVPLHESFILEISPQGILEIQADLLETYMFNSEGLPEIHEKHVKEMSPRTLEEIAKPRLMYKQIYIDAKAIVIAQEFNCLKLPTVIKEPPERSDEHEKYVVAPYIEFWEQVSEVSEEPMDDKFIYKVVVSSDIEYRLNLEVLTRIKAVCEDDNYALERDFACLHSMLSPCSGAWDDIQKNTVYIVERDTQLMNYVATMLTHGGTYD